jgi:hypothetical protein
MSSMRTATVVPNEVGTGGFGRRNDVNLNAAFGGSPIGKTRTYNEDAVKNAGISVLNGGGGPGDAIPNIDVRNGLVDDHGYYGLTEKFDLNYGSVPLETTQIGGEGLPASPYVPNLASPGPGSVSPSDQPEYVGNLPIPGNEYGSGMGGIVSPSATTPSIASQKIGSYISGRSYVGSDGMTS